MFCVYTIRRKSKNSQTEQLFDFDLEKTGEEKKATIAANFIPNGTSQQQQQRQRQRFDLTDVLSIRVVVIIVWDVEAANREIPYKGFERTNQATRDRLLRENLPSAAARKRQFFSWIIINRKSEHASFQLCS
jgi:hypothetical protein